MSANKKKRKSNRLSKRFVLFFSILAMVCLFILFQIKTGGLSLSKLIYTIGSGISGTADETSISFDSNENNRFLLTNKGLFILAPDGLRVYNISGEEKNFIPLAYRTPAISGKNKSVAVFNRGGTDFIITNGENILLDAKAPAPITSMNMNKNGAFSLVTSGPDCKSLITAYNKNCKEIYKLYSSTEYVASAAISPDSKRMVTLSFTVENGQFVGKLMFYKLSEEAPYATVTLPDIMPLDVNFADSDDLTVLCQDRFIKYNANAEKKTEVLFNDGKLSFTATGSNKLFAFILDNRSTDSSFELISCPRNAAQPYSIKFSEEVYSLSSAGNYIAVQFLDKVVVYTSDLTERHSFSIPAGARSSIVREDGTLLLIGNNWANLLVP